MARLYSFKEKKSFRNGFRRGLRLKKRRNRKYYRKRRY